MRPSIWLLEVWGSIRWVDINNKAFSLYFLFFILKICNLSDIFLYVFYPFIFYLAFEFVRIHQK